MLVETKARVGVFAIALGAYLPQFPTLVPEFEQQYAAFKKTIPDTVEVIDGGIVTTKELSMAAGDKFRAADVALVSLELLIRAVKYLRHFLQHAACCAGSGCPGRAGERPEEESPGLRQHRYAHLAG